MSALDREMGYTDLSTSCRSPHPDHPDIVCRRTCTHGTTDHASGYGAGRLTWASSTDPRPEWAVVPVTRA